MAQTGQGRGRQSENAPTLTSITFIPSKASVISGQTVTVTAMGIFDDQSQLNVTTDLTWSADPSGNAQIDNSNSQAVIIGTTGSAIAQVTITAGDDDAGVENSMTLTVIPAAPTTVTVTPSTQTIPVGTPPQQFTAKALDSNGVDMHINNFQWSSDNPAVATVDSTGKATAVSPGTANISATVTPASGGPSVKGSASLIVDTAILSSITVTPASVSVGSGQTTQLAATGIYSDGKSLDITGQASWTSTNAKVATVSAGRVAVQSGNQGDTCNIQASLPDKNNKLVLSNPVPLIVLLNFPDLGAADVQAFANAKSRVNQLLTAFERRGNLSDAELALLKDGLELVTQFINNNPTTPVPNFNAASKAGNNFSDLQLLGLAWNSDWSKGPIGTGSLKSNVIDDRFRAICDYLYGPPPIPGQNNLEHDPGSFPGGTGPYNGLTDDQLRVAVVYGYVLNSLATPPPYRTDASMVTPDDNNRRSLFNQAVESADTKFRTYKLLHIAALAELVNVSQLPQINVADLAKVVDILVQQGISPSNPQLSVWIDRALATAQNVGQDAPPSQIDINLPDLEQEVSQFEIVGANIFALQPAYFCSMLEELKVFQVVEKLVELFQNGVLPVVRGDAGNLLFAWWKNAALRVSEVERRGFYARSLGFPGGDADNPNREFKGLFMRFVSAVSAFVRQNTVDNLLRSNIPGAISQQQVRKSARDLATNISAHGYGIAYPMATELQKEINDVMAILKNSEIESAYGAKDPWQLVDQVAALELGGAANSVKYRTMASAGAVVFAWLANKSTLLATNSYVPILDITQLQLPPSFSTKPTTNPSDFDLVGACDQWLAVTGTQEDAVEQQAQPVEAPIMPSRPIQIPSVARDMLESVGVPSMAYAAAAGKGNGSAYNWRVK